MVWHNAIAAQWLAPLGEVATTCAGQAEHHHGPGRWRS